MTPRYNAVQPPSWLLGYALVLWTACTVAAIYSVDASRSTNALDLPLQNETMLRQLVPQGWAFFTKDPQSEGLHAFSLEGDGWTPAGPGPGASPEHLFGFDRRARAFGTEIAMLSSSGQSEVVECTGDPRQCLAEFGEATAVRNTSPSPALCGDVGLVLRKPIPWAWANSRKPVHMRSRVVVLEVEC